MQQRMGQRSANNKLMIIKKKTFHSIHEIDNVNNSECNQLIGVFKFSTLSKKKEKKKTEMRKKNKTSSRRHVQRFYNEEFLMSGTR